MKKIRILVVEDQNVVREGLVAILNFQADMEVVGEAEDGICAVEVARKTRPTVVLLDMVMPRQDGLLTIPKLKLAVPEARILVLSSFAESDRVFRAITAGAMGYMLKDSTRVQLLQAIREIASGVAQLQPSMAMRIFHEFDRPAEGAAKNPSLTRRELEALRLIARGYSNQEIATSLVVHERTIAKYVSNILNKLHVSNRTQAALYAIREGLAAAAD